MEGLQLYSIGVHASGGGEDLRHVFMLGEGADQPWVSSYPSQELLLQAFQDWLQERKVRRLDLGIAVELIVVAGRERHDVADPQALLIVVHDRLLGRQRELGVALVIDPIELAGHPGPHVLHAERAVDEHEHLVGLPDVVGDEGERSEHHDERRQPDREWTHVDLRSCVDQRRDLELDVFLTGVDTRSFDERRHATEFLEVGLEAIGRGVCRRRRERQACLPVLGRGVVSTVPRHCRNRVQEPGIH